MPSTTDSPPVLTIAGSDCSGVAGIRADQKKAFGAHGCYNASVITAFTAQNTTGIEVIPYSSFVCRNIGSSPLHGETGVTSRVTPTTKGSRGQFHGPSQFFTISNWEAYLYGVQLEGYPWGQSENWCLRLLFFRTPKQNSVHEEGMCV